MPARFRLNFRHRLFQRTEQAEFLTIDTMHQKSFSLASSKLGRLKFQQKFVSFLIVTAAVFAIAILGWSLSIKGYQTQTEFTIRLSSESSARQDFQTLLASTIRTKITEPNLKLLLNKVREEVPLISQILQADFNRLRESLMVQTAIAEEAQTLRIQLVLQGRGSNDERLFLRDFTLDLTEALARANSSAISDQFVIENAFTLRCRRILENLGTSIDQLETKVLEVDQLCRSINHRSPPSSSGSGPFRSASISLNSKDDQIADLQQTIANIDLDYMRASLTELRSELATQTAGQQYIPAEIETTPIGNPHPKQLLILMIMASAMGAFISIHFQPFAERGFANLAAVSRLLKVPVVATFPNNQRRRFETLPESSNVRKLPWANRITHYASLWLLAFLVFIAGFCCISEEIRGTLFRNPVDGLSRILWYFRSR